MRLKIATFLMYLVAAAWAVFGLGWLFLTDDRFAEIKYLYGPVGLAAGVFFALLAFFLRRRKLMAWRLSVLSLVFTVLLLLSDQLGWLDFSYMGLAALTFLSLLIARPGLLAPQEPEPDEVEPEEGEDEEQ